MLNWACLRDICQLHNTAAMQNKKRRFIHIDQCGSGGGGGGGEDDNDAYNVDLISGLPDDVLIYILSLAADMKTAGRTSLLSKRWTHVWTHIMDLDFNDPETVDTLKVYQVVDRYPQPHMDKFVDWVNRVIRANQAPYLNTLTINFPLNNSYATHIHNWLKFAFAKPVHNLSLNLNIVTYPRIHFFNIFSTNNPASVLNNTLVSLYLKSVSIKGPLLQWVLTNCLNLQRLTLHCCRASDDKDDASSSTAPQQVLVVSSLELKHLEFYSTLKLLNFKTLHLSAPNLTSFVFYESEIDVEYGSGPSLVDATFTGSYFHHSFHDSDILSGFSSQLEKLSILLDEVRSACSDLWNFVNVQQLEIVFDPYCYGDDLLPLTSLIKACPLLHTFKLKLLWRSKQLERRMTQISSPKLAQVNGICSHQHLKTVEYVGYAGCPYAAGLALCLTRHAPMLQRFIIHTCQPRLLAEMSVYDSDYMDPKVIERETKSLAERIRIIRGLVNVVIL